MSQPAAAPPQGADGADPSMEDILASIRRILNDESEAGGEAPGEAGAPPAEAEAPQPRTTPPQAILAADVFELDQAMIVEEPADHAYEPPRPVHDPAPETPDHHEPLAEDDRLLAPATEAAASASMGALVRVLGQRQTPVYRGGPTLEDIVRDEIRPLVKNWLDENLAQMVERMVRAEIERVTSRSI